MKLAIKRDQSGGNFRLACRVELSQEEQELIGRYGAGQSPLVVIGAKQVTISDLVRGVSDERKDVTAILNKEEEIKKACEGFKALLSVMASFGGEEVIEI